MAKDFTKFSVSQIGNKLTKSGLVKAIVHDYAKINNPTFKEIINIFPDDLQGSSVGVIKKKIDVDFEKKFKGRYFDLEPIHLSDGEIILISNQWGIDNISKFISKAVQLGYSIEQSKTIETNEVNTSIDLRQIDIFDFVKHLNNLNDTGGLEELYHDIDLLLLEDPSFASFAALLEFYSQENEFSVQYEFESKDDYINIFSFGYDQLQNLNLIELAIEESEMTSQEITTDSAALAIFQRNLLSYIFYCIKYGLVQEANGEIIGSFIFSLQSRKCKDWENEEDFVNSFVLFFVQNTFGVAITSFDEIVSDIPPFSDDDRWEESGYDYLGGGREIFDYLND